MSASISGPAFEHPPGIPSTLAEFIKARVEQNPAGRCIEIDQAGERASKTFAELDRRAAHILAVLRERVTAAECDVVLGFESALDFAPAAWACIYGGYTCHPWHMVKSPGADREIEWRLEAIGQRLNRPVLVTTDRIRSKLAGRDGLPFRTVLAIDADVPATDQAATAAHPAEPPAPAADAAFLIATSGTSATAKFAVITYRCMLNRYLALQAQMSRQERIFYFPFDGIAGILIMYPAPADRIYLQPGRFAAQPLELLMLAAEFRLRGFGSSSSMLARVLDAAEAAPDVPDLSSLRHIGLGGERIVPDVVRRLGTQARRMAAPDLKLWLVYGMTETGGICWTEKIGIAQALEPLAASGDAFSVGPCVTGCSLRIVDDDGRPVSADAAGNIEVRSDTQMFAGYKNDPELDAQSFSPDGWFRTGDIGIVSNGALTIVGRQKATIIVNAKKFSLEAVEAPLRQLEGVHRSLVAAAAVRREESATDELAVFFVPDGNDKAAVDGLGRRIVDMVAWHSGIPVKHLVPVGEADFPLTTTGKVRRDELVRRYQTGALGPLALARNEDAAAGRALTETESWLTELWRSALRLDTPPGLEDNFHALGGDSLASSEIIFAVEDKFSCELPIEAFFQNPTIATLRDLVERHQDQTAPPSGGGSHASAAGHRLLHKLQSYMVGWPGERLFADSLVVGLNRAGRRPPLFLLCQESQEFQQLAKHLGPDQPVYGMRSCVGIVAVKDYSTDVIETVCNRYLWEILALPVTAPLAVCGVCQAGIFALALARRLKQIGRAPAPLILIEWTYSLGRYTEPTVLLYGDRSYTAEIYRDEGTRAPNWREDFPQRSVAPIPGEHGNLFVDENIGGMADVIRRHLGPLAQRAAGQRRWRWPLSIVQRTGRVSGSGRF